MRKSLTAIVVLLLIVAGVILSAIPYYASPMIARFVGEKLAALGLDSFVSLDLGYCWRNGPGIEGSLRLAIPETPWRVKATFGASCCEWSAQISMRETAFSETDPLVKMLLARYPMANVSNLVLSGSVALDAKVERTYRKPVPVWDVKVPIRKLDVGMVSGGQTLSVEGLSVTAGASGIADHIDISPMFARANSAVVGKCSLTNFYATIRATEKSLIVNEAGAELCGGTVSIYSLHLNPKSLNAGFTLFLEDVDAGRALAFVNGFQGEASGRLHGKLKVFVREGGKGVRLRDMFLYSTPGEAGKLRMTNPDVLTDNLT